MRNSTYCTRTPTVYVTLYFYHIVFFLNIHIIGSSERDWFIYRPMPGYRLLYHLLLYVGT